MSLNGKMSAQVRKLILKGGDWVELARLTILKTDRGRLRICRPGALLGKKLSVDIFIILCLNFYQSPNIFLNIPDNLRARLLRRHDEFWIKDSKTVNRDSNYP